MISFRSDVQERVSHRPECTKMPGVHILVDRRKGGWGDTEMIVTLVCCECEAHKIFRESNGSQTGIVQILLRTVQLRMRFDEELACSGCGGQRHIGWCGA